MKVNQSITFSHEVEGRHYSMSFPVPAPLGECYDVAAAACNEFLKKLKEQQDKIAEDGKQVQADEQPAEGE